jgi:hypothetical protein
MAQAERVGTHVPDAEWLIALWLAIHGGDPAPGETIVGEAAAREAALGIIAAVAPYALAASTGARVEILAKLGVTVTKHPKGLTAEEFKNYICYSTGYGHYCINYPAPPPPPREF